MSHGPFSPTSDCRTPKNTASKLKITLKKEKIQETDAHKPGLFRSKVKKILLCT